MTGFDPHPANRDERIAAFLDGALDDAEQAAFEEEMARDPALAREVERLMDNDALLREAIAGEIGDEVDDRLLERMGLGAGAASSAPGIPLPAAANDNPPFWQRWRLPLGGAIAAGLALAVMVGMQRQAVPGSGLDAALDATPSGQVATLADGRSLRPVLTFKSGDGRFCREYAISSGEGGESGVACRSAKAWKIEGKARGATELAEGGEIGLAAGADGGSLDAAYARLGAGDPITADSERALIAGGWKEMTQ